MVYDACVFQGARRKGQKIRHNVQELSQLPPLRCGHVHHHQEWQRNADSFPTKEEAEYTPSFLTSWAARHGYAVLKISATNLACRLELNDLSKSKQESCDGNWCFFLGIP